MICCDAQVFLDVVESVNLLVNSNGTVVRSEVVGALKMRTYLSGMPECKLGLNDKVHVDFVTGLSSRRSHMYKLALEAASGPGIVKH